MHEDILVTILLATHNGERYLAQQMDSIIDQTHNNWRVFVSDDRSTDNTCSLINAYIKRYPEKIEFIDNSNGFGSACANFFFLLKQAVERDIDYVMFCDQDDVWAADKIEISLKAMIEAEVKAGAQCPLLVFTDLEVADSQMNLHSKSFMTYSHLKGTRTLLRHLLIQNVVTGCTMMINKALSKLSLQNDEETCVLMHDWWIALTASTLGKIIFLDVVLVRYRQHEKNSIGAKNVMSLKYLINKIFIDNNIRVSMRHSMKQAKQFYKTYGSCLSKEDAVLVKNYSELGDRRKPYRIVFLIKQRVFKYGFFRKIAQIVWV